ncbi:MAG TPA: SgcJ/EcaC family oxidoreductase [Herpetosiphonaceae bacterium]|nr:SgcJ/EcaC family oxidoreductase [Herpetosiphonaceae bacterium]
MKTALYCALATCLAALAAASTSAKVTEITSQGSRVGMTKLLTPADVTARYETAWNTHDMELFATLFHHDATFVNRFGTYWKGVDAIVNGHRAIHETVYRDSTLKIDPPEVQMLSDDISIVHFWTRLTTGEAHPTGPHQTDTLVMAVLTRREGNWRIQAAENVTLTDPRSGKPLLRGN